MKKYIISLVLLSVTVCAHAQLFDFSSNNNRYEIGLNVGQMAFDTQFARMGMGMNTLAWGVYLDFNMSAPPSTSLIESSATPCGMTTSSST